jgi:alginate O-acetyltransferase complex protein AlgI
MARTGPSSPWGGLHGLYLIINHLARAVLPATPGLGRLVIGRCLTLLAVIVAWVFFRADSLSAARRVLSGMAGLNAAASSPGWDVKQAAWLAGLSLLTQIAPSSNEIADRLHRLLGSRRHAGTAA